MVTTPLNTFYFNWVKYPILNSKWADLGNIHLAYPCRTSPPIYKCFRLHSSTLTNAPHSTHPHLWTDERFATELQYEHAWNLAILYIIVLYTNSSKKKWQLICNLGACCIEQAVSFTVKCRMDLVFSDHSCLSDDNFFVLCTQGMCLDACERALIQGIGPILPLLGLGLIDPPHFPRCCLNPVGLALHPSECNNAVYNICIRMWCEL